MTDSQSLNLHWVRSIQSFVSVFDDTKIASFATIAFFTSLLVGLMIVVTRSWHIRFTSDYIGGVQKFHTGRTPRIGGVSLVAGLLVVSVFGFGQLPQGHPLKSVGQLFNIVNMAAIPAFLFGFIEDITHKVSPFVRLLATAFSGLLACWATGYSLENVDVWGLNFILSFAVVSYLFTVTSVAGVANSLNIIDGFNGLASITATMAFLGYGLMAYQVADTSLLVICILYAAVVAGFFIINWPYGRLFLGDGGAYLTGFLLAWVAVMLKVRHEQISAFAIVIVLAYPLIEMIFTIYRRLVRNLNPGMPDSLHFHSLLKRRYVSRWFAHRSKKFRNSLVGLWVGSMSVAGVLLGYTVMFSDRWSLAVLFMLVVGYILMYSRMVNHRWVLPWQVLKP